MSRARASVRRRRLSRLRHAAATCMRRRDARSRGRLVAAVRAYTAVVRYHHEMGAVFPALIALTPPRFLTRQKRRDRRWP